MELQTQPVAPSIGNNLKVLAKLRGITQEEIAKQCEISRISVNRFFAGHTQVRAEDFIAILRIFGIDVPKIVEKQLEEGIRGDLLK